NPENAMTVPCIITVAITGSLPTKADNPAVPITIAEQIESTQEAFEAGAALAHCHVRDDSGKPTSDPERFGAPAGRPQKALPGHDRATFHWRPIGHRSRARWHAAAQGRHGVSLDRLVQFPDARLRERAGTRRMAGVRDAGL